MRASLRRIGAVVLRLLFQLERARARLAREADALQALELLVPMVPAMYLAARYWSPVWVAAAGAVLAWSAPAVASTARLSTWSEAAGGVGTAGNLPGGGRRPGRPGQQHGVAEAEEAVLLGDGLVTGPTRTNVNDFRVTLIAP